MSSCKDSFLDCFALDGLVNLVIAHILNNAENWRDRVDQLLPLLHADVTLTLQHYLLAFQDVLLWNSIRKSESSLYAIKNTRAWHILIRANKFLVVMYRYPCLVRSA
jgi:hypothetical protein